MRRKICYIVGMINYNGGAHIATAKLISQLTASGYEVDILTNEDPTEATISRFGASSIRVVKYPYHNLRWIIGKVCLLVFSCRPPDWTLDPLGKHRKWLARHDVVCVMAEQSGWRGIVASLPNSVRKVQMIHTDYVGWSKALSRRKGIKYDAKIYPKYDCIAVVGKPNAERVKKCLPRIADKIVPFYNILKTVERPNVERSESKNIRIVTLSRLEVGGAKCVDKMIRVAAKLKAAGVEFDWTVYGDGDREKLDQIVRELGVSDVFHMPGYSPRAQEELAKADLSVMLSDYEGLSNGIYESMMLGVPVFSTNVGGAEEQIQDGVNGWLVENDEETIFEKLKAVLSNCEAIKAARDALKDYSYDNDAALNEHLKILGLEEDA